MYDTTKNVLAKRATCDSRINDMLYTFVILWHDFAIFGIQRPAIRYSRHQNSKK